jgi:hypothetical protein
MTKILYFKKKTLPLFRSVPALASGENREVEYVPVSITIFGGGSLLFSLMDSGTHT